MRRRLGEEEGKFCEYTAEFGFYAAKRGQNKVNNALFKNIRDAEGNFITDHVWIPIRLIDVFLTKGDHVQFMGKVGQYHKQRKNRICKKVLTDYNFVDIGEMRIVN